MEIKSGDKEADRRGSWAHGPVLNQGIASVLKKSWTLLPDRIDENMPFIDSGYVDESQPDVMAELGKLGEGLGKLFGGGGDGKK